MEEGRKMKKNRTSTKMIVLTGMFAAVLAALSQVQIPMPSGVPVTLQTFAVALTGYVLGWKYGLASTAIYTLLGAIGLPVFAGFSGGVGVIAGATGGFIWGFLFMAALCGYGYSKKRILLGVYSLVGLIICHLLGVIQFMFLMQMSFAESFLLVSMPYLLKDVISVVAAYVVAKAIRAGLLAAGFSTVSRV